MSGAIHSELMRAELLGGTPEEGLSGPIGSSSPGLFDVTGSDNRTLGSLRLGWMFQIASFGVCSLALLAAMNPALPLWLQPTVIGMLWGALFMVGFLLGADRGRSVALLVACFICAALFLHTFQVLTDFAFSGSLLVTTWLLMFGWLTGRTDATATACFLRAVSCSSTPVSLATAESPAVNPWLRWSILDIVFATGVVACFCQSATHLIAHPLLLIGVHVSLFGGVLYSWLAHRWVWNDRISWWRSLLTVSTMTLVAIFVCQLTPVGRVFDGNLAWMLSGPLNVMAAQGTFVLFGAALLRVDCKLQCASSAMAGALPMRS